MFFGVTEEWRPVDLLAAEALTAYEDGLCSGCGQHSSLTMTDYKKNIRHFELDDSLVCIGCELKEKASQSEKPTEPGTKLRILNDFD